MTTVERSRTQLKTPPVYWADQIEISNSAEALSICGQKLFPPSRSSKHRDLVSGCAYAISGARVPQANKAAHFAFANCSTEEAFTEFVLRYGPVLAEATSVKAKATRYDQKCFRTELSACQRWDVLQREQRTLAAALQLFEQIRSDRPVHNAVFCAARSIVLGTSYWVDAYNREVETRRPLRSRDSPSWIWSVKHQQRAQLLANAISPLASKDSRSRANSQAHDLLCHVLDAFPVRLTRYCGAPVEMPGEDVSFGVFPAFYFLLRWDYLWDAKVARCAWEGCKRWFRVGSHDSRCCSDEHSLKHRQWVYYHEGRGKQMRQRRREKDKGSRRVT